MFSEPLMKDNGVRVKGERMKFQLGSMREE